MTWTRDDCPGHTGTLIGLATIPLGDPRARFGDQFRELNESDASPDTPPWYPDAVQVACTCGWRSARLDAPINCYWGPAGLTTSEWFTASVRSLWRSHAIGTVFSEQEAARVRGGG